MEPEKVNPRNFKVKEIVYDNKEFSIAYGKFENGDYCIAMRWNGDGDANAGYPKTFGNPMWFIIDNRLKSPILKALINEKHSINSSIIKVLQEELK
jgi:hypothetical protein